MNRQVRYRAILDLLRARGPTSVGELARLLHVSPITVRRDLEHLQQEGLVERFHGGASLSRPEVEPSLADRLALRQTLKEAVARAAVAYLRQTLPRTVILDSGSTTYQWAKAYAADPWEATVFTNDPHIATLLTQETATPVFCSGGLLRRKSLSFVGEMAVEFFRQLRVEVAVLGANGLDVGHGVMASGVHVQAVKRAMADAAERIVVVADHTKFGEPSVCKVLPWERVEAVFTDGFLPLSRPEVYRALRARGVRVHAVPAEEAAKGGEDGEEGAAER